MTGQEEGAAQPFIDAYDRVREDEKWGGDDLDLPFHPKRHHTIWAIRRRTFLRFQSLATRLERGIAVDVGAGNCWMTRYLDAWGFDAIAVDINESPRDGLRAGQKFIDTGSRFLRVRSPMERLPFVPDRIRLIATNASFHYSSDYRIALSEFVRVLTPGGIIAIIDSPFYESAADGDRMVRERVVEFQRKYGISEELARQSGYFTLKELNDAAASLNLEVRVEFVWPGFRRTYESIRSRLADRRVARFPLVVLEKRA
jgi:SAM-dependent methyltransferase